ncbi:hypothetical protein PFISCL1PPCAC_26307, partial [Pristionchus fissidentatus]
SGGQQGGWSGRSNNGPSFLQNLTKEAVNEYNKIQFDQSLTKAQHNSAIGNWSATYNVTEEMDEFNTEQQQLLQQKRANTTAVVQQLNSTLNQIYAIEDNESLTPWQVRKQIGQVKANLTYPLNSLVGSALGSEKTRQGKDKRGGWDSDSDEKDKGRH